MRHSYLCEPRWSDMDRFGHINNTRFLTYLEQARVDLLFHTTRDVSAGNLADGVVIVRHEIDYLRPVEYRHEPLRVETWCERVSGASFVLGYEVFDGAGTAAPVAARARSTLAPYDLAAGRPRRLTEAEREYLRRYTDGGPS